MNKTTKFMCEAAICVAIGIVLDYIAGLYSEPLFVAGGSIGIAMIAIFIMSYRWGLKGGLLTGLLIGVIQTFYGAYFVHWVQIFLDYWGAYTVVGFAGVFANKISKEQTNQGKCLWIILSILLGVTLRLVCAFTSGVIFFAEWAPAELGPVLYSLVYNMGYLIPSAILCAIILCIMQLKAPKLLEKNFESSKISRDNLFSITSSLTSIVAIILFSGKILVKKSPFASNVVGFDVAFGFTNSFKATEASFTTSCNIFALLSFILLLVSALIMLIPEKYKSIKFISSSILTLVSFILLFFVPSTLKASIVSAYEEATIAFNYPYYLLVSFCGITFLVNVILLVISLVSEKKTPRIESK